MSKPAFPNGPGITGGMTKRQYYKAEALSGLMANPSVVGHDAIDVSSDAIALFCGRMADAMIAEDAKHATN